MPELPRRPERPVLAPDPARGEVQELAGGTELARIYFRGGVHPGSWNGFRRHGPTSARFDHHVPPQGSRNDRGILYAGGDITTAAGEVFQETRVIDTIAGQPYLAILRTSRTVRLLDLRSDWPTRAGGSQLIASGNRGSARNWSRAVYEDHAGIEGIVWDSSMHRGGAAYALYEQAENAIEPDPIANEPLSHWGLALPLTHATDTLRFGLVIDSGLPSWMPPMVPLGIRATRRPAIRRARPATE